MTIYDAIELVKQPLLDIRKVVTETKCIIHQGRLTFLLSTDTIPSPIKVHILFMSIDSDSLVCLVCYGDEGKLVVYDGNDWTIEEIRPK